MRAGFAFCTASNRARGSNPGISRLPIRSRLMSSALFPTADLRAEQLSLSITYGPGQNRARQPHASNGTPTRERRSDMASATDISAFATSQLSLLTRELNAELTETHLLTSTHAPTVLQRAGLALLNLSVASQRTGFGGRTLLELSLDPAVGGGGLPEHGLRVGDICAVGEQPRGAERKKEREGMEKRGVEGVVTRVQREGVTVALDKEEAEVAGGKLWLCVCRLRCAWREFHENGSGRGIRLMCRYPEIVLNWPTMSRTNV
nr:dna polymerase alpha-associated dna helicase a [Quercus suber]